MTDKKIKAEKDIIRFNALKSITESRIIYLFAFIVPIIIMVAIYIIREIYPFGNNAYLRSDMYHQYCPFFSELWSKLRSGDSLFYSWDIGMGTNFLSIFGYYLSSPVNFLIALFPQNAMIEIMNVFIILKIAASCFTCTYYLCCHNKKRSLSCLIFGLFYALSAYIAAYSWNIMWLDCIVLLPLIILGLEKLVKEGKGLLYTITLGFAILSNYYISIMICLSLVLYFIVLVVKEPVPEDKRFYGNCVIRFILYSLLAGGLAGIILIPEIQALSYTASGSFNFPKNMTRYFSFITMIKRHLINTPVSTGLDHLPNIYCGVLTFILLPLYALNKNISLKERIAKILLLVSFFLAFNLNILNYIWHGFHLPNSLPCRQSFIYILFLLTMCNDGFHHFETIGRKRFAASFFAVVFLFIYLGNTFTNEEADFKSLYFSAIFILIYALILLCLNRKKIVREIAILLLFTVSIVECVLNMEKTGYLTTSRTDYLADYSSIKAINEQVALEDEDLFYRTTKYRGYRSKNDSAWHNFKGGSIFSSTAYAALTNFYDGMGLEHSTNAYSVNGATPLIYSIFNFKYLLSNKDMTDNEIFKPYLKCENETVYLNQYALPLAFMVPENFNTSWNVKESNNPFVVQNCFAKLAAGVDNLFERITFEDYDSNAVIIPEKDEYLYMYIMNKSIEKIEVTIGSEKEYFTGINHGRMIDLGPVKKGQRIEVTSTGKGTPSLQMYAYTLNMNKFKDFYNRLADEGMEITSFSSTETTGKISVNEDGLLFTSIPYDKSYTIYVDGKKTDYTYTGNKAFIALNLSKGEHTIRFKYTPSGFRTGLFFTLLCTLCIISCILFRVKFKKEISEPGSLNLIKEKRNSKRKEEN